jgi:hypothetical protein
MIMQYGCHFEAPHAFLRVLAAVLAGPNSQCCERPAPAASLLRLTGEQSGPGNYALCRLPQTPATMPGRCRASVLTVGL